MDLPTISASPFDQPFYPSHSAFKIVHGDNGPELQKKAPKNHSSLPQFSWPGPELSPQFPTNAKKLSTSPYMIAFPVLSQECCTQIVKNLHSLPLQYPQGLRVDFHPGFDKLGIALTRWVEPLVKTKYGFPPDSTVIACTMFMTQYLKDEHTPYPPFVDDSDFTLDICLSTPSSDDQVSDIYFRTKPQKKKFHPQAGMAILFPGKVLHQIKISSSKALQIHLIMWLKVLYCFPKFQQLPDEIQKSFHSYLDPETLVAFKICSKQTNQSVQPQYQLGEFRWVNICNCLNTELPKKDLLSQETEMKQWVQTKSKLMAILGEMDLTERRYIQHLEENIEKHVDEVHRPYFHKFIDFAKIHLQILGNEYYAIYEAYLPCLIRDMSYLWTQWEKVFPDFLWDCNAGSIPEIMSVFPCSRVPRYVLMYNEIARTNPAWKPLGTGFANIAALGNTEKQRYELLAKFVGLPHEIRREIPLEVAEFNDCKLIRSQQKTKSFSFFSKNKPKKGFSLFYEFKGKCCVIVAYEEDGELKFEAKLVVTVDPRFNPQHQEDEVLFQDVICPDDGSIWGNIVICGANQTILDFFHQHFQSEKKDDKEES